MTSLSIIIPTAGRLSLRRTLESIEHQRLATDEVIVVGDTHDGPLPRSEAIAAEFEARYLEHDDGAHGWGHPQINVGLDAARCEWLTVNDDDDVYTPDAFDAIRSAIAEQPYPRPLLFQFVTPWRSVLWAEPVIAEARIGGHCLVQPNVAGKVARMTPRYVGDFDWIVEAARLYDGDVGWIPRIIAWTRPTETEWETQLAPKVMVG